MHIILASASPRRKDILKAIIPIDAIIKPDIDESEIPGEDPFEYSVRIAREKNAAVKPEKNNTVIITSDTLVTIDKSILGKPEDKDDAFKMLKSLEGKKHQVISSICIRYIIDNREILKCRAEKSEVYFKNLDNRAIENYISLVHVYDKAGAYAIQERGDLIVDKIEGSMTNIIGFPLRLFFSIIVEMKLEDILFKI